MEKDLKFNSQVCTTKEQSQRLLDLGLKPETADCYYYANQRWNGNDYENTGELIISPMFNQNDKDHYDYLIETFGDEIGENNTPYVIPAWSLHRLIELYKDVEDTSMWSLELVNYDRIIQCIGLAIKHNDFNKEYLV